MNSLKFIIEALYSLRPGSVWNLNGTAYEGLVWKDETQSKPSKEELEEKIEEIKATEPMRLLRVERNRLLEETDWVTMRAYSTKTDIPEEWASYQQVLRDLPETAIPVLDSSNCTGISGVNWPVKP